MYLKIIEHCIFLIPVNKKSNIFILFSLVFFYIYYIKDEHIKLYKNIYIIKIIINIIYISNNR